MWEVFFILPIELCERFSFFGTRTLLNQYLKAGFGMSDEQAKSYVHLFNGLVCMFPVVGAVISDSYLGKFNSVAIFSLLSVLGNSLFAILSIDGLVGEFGEYPLWAFLVPAVLLTLGSGSAKPCVGSHGGDQFDDKDGIDRFFSLLVVTTYIGILMAVMIVPLIKDNLGYTLAYAIPTFTMLIALVVFVSAKRFFKTIPPQRDLFPWKIIKLVAYASVRKLKGHCADNWLELASDKYSDELVQEARQVLKVIVMFSPLVFVWMLHEQNTTEWQNQYEMMEKTLFGINVPTEACSVYGVVLSIVLTPATGILLFPFLERHGIKISAGMRVALGYLLILSSFVMSTSLQYWVRFNSTNQVRRNNITVSCAGCINGAWQIPQWLLFSLGEAIIMPAACFLAYSNVGPNMKASAISIAFVSMAMGNYAVIVLEPILSLTSDRILRQWCYVLISSLFLLVYMLLLKFWFIPTPSPPNRLIAKLGNIDHPPNKPNPRSSQS
ncbi:hypothetical protein DSO57_1000998 [Entomophthora muscae]|uniref:Uncharacterized protein n=1 Tax=Entomophthora muscae TaxID=34485 RepID=A0ACC2UI22_9FUNG|nr:hypothetical protein DSO57_1000998 [Entomophthora muscae]